VHKPEMFPIAVCYEISHPTVSDLVSNDKCQRTITGLQ